MAENAQDLIIKGARFPHPFLDEKSAEIRIKRIQWDSFVSSNLISENDAKALNDFETVRQKPAPEYFEKKGVELCKAIVEVLKKVTSPDLLKFILVVLDDVLPSKKRKITLNSRGTYQIFKDNVNLTEFFSYLARGFNHSDELVSWKSISVLEYLANLNFKIPNEHFGEINEWLTISFNSSDKNILLFATQILQSLLRIDSFRIYYSDNGKKSLKVLITLLKNEGQNPQLQYQIIFSIWLLSFSHSIAASLQSEFEILPIFMTIAKNAVKEKVIRMIVAVFRNMLERAREENMYSMIGIKLVSFAETLSSRKFTDEEIIEDLKYLKQELGVVFQNLSTFDEYSSEVRSGKLEWTPPHQSDLFWKQNVSKFQEKDMELLKMLVKILSSSTDPTVLSIACHDIGQYVKFYPNGKKYVQDLGAKQKVMLYMTHDNQEVRYHALIAVQKYMMNSWNQ